MSIVLSSSYFPQINEVCFWTLKITVDHVNQRPDFGQSK